MKKNFRIVREKTKLSCVAVQWESNVVSIIGNQDTLVAQAQSLH